MSNNRLLDADPDCQYLTIWERDPTINKRCLSGHGRVALRRLPTEICLCRINEFKQDRIIGWWTHLLIKFQKHQILSNEDASMWYMWMSHRLPSYKTRFNRALSTQNTVWCFDIIQGLFLVSEMLNYGTVEMIRFSMLWHSRWMIRLSTNSWISHHYNQQSFFLRSGCFEEYFKNKLNITLTSADFIVFWGIWAKTWCWFNTIHLLLCVTSFIFQFLKKQSRVCLAINIILSSRARKKWGQDNWTINI